MSQLHPVKTKIVSMWDGKEEFDFLGMYHRRMTRGTYQSKLAGRLFSPFCIVRSVHKFFVKKLALKCCYYSVAFVLVHRVP